MEQETIIVNQGIAEMLTFENIISTLIVADLIVAIVFGILGVSV